MTIKEAERDDIPQIIQLYAALFDEELNMEEVHKNYETLNRDETCGLLVAKEKDEVVGTCSVFICPSLAEKFLVVEDVVVKAQSRELGIGKQLFQIVDEIAEANRCAYAILISSGFRKGAHIFYEKMGYVDDVRGFRKVY